MKRLLSIILCTVLIISFVSCNSGDNTESNSVTIDPIASFDTVEEFKIAVKKDPKLYKDKQVAVKGYANERNPIHKEVWLYDELLADDELYDGRVRIKVDITDSVLLDVVEDGDYIEIYGTVKISDGEIYLGNCTYNMITTNEPRQ